ncbi:MAG TPA: hypothetical protein VMI12_11860 [Puia sp.]|nr:hypothetical protein [Puia sp.]
MYHLSDQQIDFIADDITRKGISIDSVHANLLDHICIIIEQNLEENGDFQAFYRSTIKTFYRKSLSEIEEETIFLLSSRGPFILLSRNIFFLLLFIIFIGPYIAYGISCCVHLNLHHFYIPFEVWAPTFVFALFPLLILFVLYFTPNRLDPLIPWKSKIMIGVRPFLRVVSPSLS